MDLQKAINILFYGDDYEDNPTLCDVVTAIPLDILKEKNYTVAEEWVPSECLIDAIFHSHLTTGEEERLRILKYLIENGMDVNFIGKAGNSLLHETMYRQNTRCMLYLLSKGANINIQNKTEQTPLALLFENYKIYPCLCKKKAKVKGERIHNCKYKEKANLLLDFGAKTGEHIYTFERISWDVTCYNYNRRYSYVCKRLPKPPKWFILLSERRKTLKKTIVGFLCASRHFKTRNAKDVYRIIARMIWETRFYKT